MRKLGGRVLVTKEEAACYRLAQVYRQRKLWRGVLSIRALLWPVFLDELAWSDIWWRRVGQLLMLLALWPLLFLGGLFRLFGNLLLMPSRLLACYQVPKDLRSPGEKSLIGIANAFSPVLDLDEEDYIRCVNRWVSILYGDELALERNLNVYLARLKLQQKGLRDGSNRHSKGARRDLVIARERLSKDLGHYLVDR